MNFLKALSWMRDPKPWPNSKINKMNKLVSITIICQRNNLFCFSASVLLLYYWRLALCILNKSKHLLHRSQNTFCKRKLQFIYIAYLRKYRLDYRNRNFLERNLNEQSFRWRLKQSPVILIWVNPQLAMFWVFCCGITRLRVHTQGLRLDC